MWLGDMYEVKMVACSLKKSAKYKRKGDIVHLPSYLLSGGILIKKKIFSLLSIIVIMIIIVITYHNRSMATIKKEAVITDYNIYSMEKVNVSVESETIYKNNDEIELKVKQNNQNHTSIQESSIVLKLEEKQPYAIVMQEEVVQNNSDQKSVTKNWKKKMELVNREQVSQLMGNTKNDKGIPFVRNSIHAVLNNEKISFATIDDKSKEMVSIDVKRNQDTMYIYNQFHTQLELLENAMKALEEGNYDKQATDQILAIMLSKKNMAPLPKGYYDWTQKNELEVLAYCIALNKYLGNMDHNRLDYLYARNMKEIITRLNNLHVMIQSPLLKKYKLS